MPYNSNVHHRKSIRLKGYDYSQAGLYFVTLCVQNRECIFGHIENGNMILNDAGNIANDCWLNIPNHFPNVRLHEHIIMPNHVHGIIEISVGANHHSPIDVSNHHSPIDVSNHHSPIDVSNHHSPDDVSNHHSPDDVTIHHAAEMNVNKNDHSYERDDMTKNAMENRAKDVSPLWAKDVSPLRSPSKTIGSVVRGYKIGVTKWFRQNNNVGIIWQRNYYEHIIRNQQSYINILNYIVNNHAQWNADQFFKE